MFLSPRRQNNCCKYPLNERLFFFVKQLVSYLAEIVNPGEQLGICEEFVAGPGTFEENGKIYSLFLGVAERDGQSRKISVIAAKQVRPLAEGDLVYGVVQQLYEAMTMVRFAPVAQGNQVPAGGDTAFIRISELQNGYVEQLRDCIRTGDIVKARVLQISALANYLTLKERDLGVIKALCSMCRAEMKPSQGGFFTCPYCGSREPRKTPSSGDESSEGSYEREGGNERGRSGGFGGRRGGSDGEGRGGFGGRDRGRGNYGVRSGGFRDGRSGAGQRR